MPLSLVEGAMMAAGAAAVLVVVRYLIAYAREEDAGEALSITSRWGAGLIGAAFSLGATGLVELGDAVGMLTMFVGSHPFAVSNGLVAGLGAAASEGLVSLSGPQFLGVAIALVGITMLIYEVGD
jgi:hypothetical protein